MLFPQLLALLFLAAALVAWETSTGELPREVSGRHLGETWEPAAATSVAVTSGRWSACVMSRG